MYNQASSINYLPGKGVSLQVWEDDDRSHNSVKISIPILLSPRNVFHAKTHKHLRNAHISSLEVAKTDLTTNPFTIRILENAQWTPAYPSLNALWGKTSLIPQFGNSLISAMNGAYSNLKLPNANGTSHTELSNVEANFMKFGPAGDELEFVNKYATLNEPIYEALQRALTE